MSLLFSSLFLSCFSLRPDDWKVWERSCDMYCISQVRITAILSLDWNIQRGKEERHLAIWSAMGHGQKIPRARLRNSSEHGLNIFRRGKKKTSKIRGPEFHGEREREGVLVGDSVQGSGHKTLEMDPSEAAACKTVNVHSLCTVGRPKARW